VAGRKEVDPEELRAHANHLRSLNERFAAIRDASSHIAMSDDAYGELCQMLPPLMEQRHQDQDAGMASLAENFLLLAQAIDECADDYESADSLSADDFTKLESEL
jgi:hypothetical protein